MEDESVNVGRYTQSQPAVLSSMYSTLPQARLTAVIRKTNSHQNVSSAYKTALAMGDFILAGALTTRDLQGHSAQRSEHFTFTYVNG
jgi:hypothetical protein